MLDLALCGMHRSPSILEVHPSPSFVQQCGHFHPDEKRDACKYFKLVAIAVVNTDCL